MVEAQVLRGLLAASQLTTVIVLLCWIFGPLGGVSLHPRGALLGNDTNRLFNWHPMLMVLAWTVFSAEALLAYRSPLVQQLSRQQQKTLHACLNAAAFATALVGVVAAWKSHTLKRPIPIDNLYSPHSWLGVFTLSLATLQLVGGIVVYVYPKVSPSRRKGMYRYHAFLGATTFAVAIATMLTGIQEKTTFVQVFAKAPVYSPAIRLPATLAVSIAFTAILLAAHHALLRGQPEEALDAVNYEPVGPPFEA